MNKLSQLAEAFKSAFVIIVFPVAGFAAYLIFQYVMGNPANFEGGNNMNQPLQGNYLGIVYKGGILVVVLISFAIILFTFVIERFIVISKASGKLNNKTFVKEIKKAIAVEDLDKALAICDEHKGAVSNVIRSGILTYKSVADNNDLIKEQKIATIQNDLEEASQLELPSLNNNLIIISTLASISTLYGLLGTVTGIIKSFAALARVGAPDAVGLAQGISEALVTTALGIVIGSFAIIFYNYFTNRIERITYAIDECSFSILHAFTMKK
ncbi:MAG: MotA/TolQ/ExbB proton channel family protein [Bacteroidia bacterium]